MDYDIIFGKNKIRGLDNIPSDIEVIPANEIEELEETPEETPQADIEDIIEEAIEAEKEESSTKQNDDFWESLFSEDAIDILDSARKFAHPFYYELINPVNELKEEFHTLFTQEERSKEEELRMKELYTIVQEHERNFKDFRQKIPYSDKQRKRIAKVFKKVLSKMEGAGNVPLWLELLIVFVLPELMILGTAMLHKFSK